jgi:hypothetical protein
MAHRQLRGHGQVVIFRRLQRMNRRDKVQATGSILVEMLTRGSLVQTKAAARLLWRMEVLHLKSHYRNKLSAFLASSDHC